MLVRRDPQHLAALVSRSLELGAVVHVPEGAIRPADIAGESGFFTACTGREDLPEVVREAWLICAGGVRARASFFAL